MNYDELANTLKQGIQDELDKNSLIRKILSVTYGRSNIPTVEYACRATLNEFDLRYSREPELPLKNMSHGLYENIKSGEEEYFHEIINSVTDEFLVNEFNIDSIHSAIGYLEGYNGLSASGILAHPSIIGRIKSTAMGYGGLEDDSFFDVKVYAISELNPEEFYLYVDDRVGVFNVEEAFCAYHRQLDGGSMVFTYIERIGVAHSGSGILRVKIDPSIERHRIYEEQSQIKHKYRFIFR